MKKLLLTLAVVCISGAAFAQTQSISLSDNGLYGGTNTSGTFNSTDSFTLSTTLTYSGYSSPGFSYWLEVPTALAPFISITGESFFTFTTPNSGGTGTPSSDYTFVFTDTVNHPDANFAADEGGPNTTGDLGATQPTTAQGTYHVSDLAFALNGAPAGTYLLHTTADSEVSDTSFGDNLLAETTYTITVVPEPSTWFAGFGMLGVVGFTMLRRRRTTA
jgi:MYXO-CTERM domain-containing protein